jgi:hypothetical protein
VAMVSVELGIVQSYQADYEKQHAKGIIIREGDGAQVYIYAEGNDIKRLPKFLEGDIVQYQTQLNYNDELYATDIIITDVAKKEIDEKVATKLMNTNKYMTVIQMSSPHLADYKGYDNSHFINGFKLMQLWNDTSMQSQYKHLILQSVSGMLELHMKNQLSKDASLDNERGVAPKEYRLYYSHLRKVIDSIYEGMSDEESQTISKRSYILTNKHSRITSKSIFIEPYTDENGKKGIFLATISKSDIPLILRYLNAPIEEKGTSTVRVLYYPMDEAKNLIKMVSQNRSRFNSPEILVKNIQKWTEEENIITTKIQLKG